MAVTSGFPSVLPAVDVRPFFICGKGLMRGKKNLRKVSINISNEALNFYEISKMRKKGYKLPCSYKRALVNIGVKGY